MGYRCSVALHPCADCRCLRSGHAPGGLNAPALRVWRKRAMRVRGAFGCGAGAVAIDHLAVLPAGEIPFGTAGPQVTVGECVPEHVRVEARDAGFRLCSK